MSELPEGWVQTTIGAVTRPVRRHRPDQKPDTEFTYIDISSVDNERHLIRAPKRTCGCNAPSRARQLVATGDIVLSTVRVYLKNTAPVPPALDGATASTGFCVLRPSAKVDPRFLFHTVLNDDFIRDLSTRQTGTSYPAVRDDDVRDMKFRLPPLAEQRRIVAAIEAQLTHLDAAVKSLGHARCNLDRLRAAILQDAIEGRLTQRSTTRKAAYMLLDNILKQRRSDWSRSGKKTRYREPTPPKRIERHCVPRQWAICSVDTVGEVQLGRQRSPKNHQGPHMRPYLRAANVTWNGIDFCDIKEMNFAPEELKRYKLIKGDILLNEASGTADEVGKPAIWGGEIEDCCFQNTLLRVRPSNLIDRNYLWLVFLHAARDGGFASAAKGVNILHLGKANLASWPVPLPSLDEQCRIVAEVQRQFASLDATSRLVDTAITRAAELRQAVLHKALTGQLVSRDRNAGLAAELPERLQTPEVS